MVENGSNDIRQLVNYPFRVKLIHLESAHRSIARNRGARESIVDLLIFLDADVVLAPSWVERVVKSFEADTLAVQTQIFPTSYSSSVLQSIRMMRAFRKNNRTFFSLKKNAIQNVILNSAAFGIRREVFEELKGFDEKLERHEDLDFTQRLLSLKGKVKGIRSSSCDVYFKGTMFTYCKREFSTGFHMVRFHEKWTSKSKSQAWKALSRHFAKWMVSFPTSRSPEELAGSFHLLEFCYLFGTAAGFIRMCIDPYPGPLMERRVQAQVEVE